MTFVSKSKGVVLDETGFSTCLEGSSLLTFRAVKLYVGQEEGICVCVCEWWWCWCVCVCVCMCVLMAGVGRLAYVDKYFKAQTNEVEELS